MAFPYQGSIIYSIEDSSEVRMFLQYLRQTGIIQTSSSVGFPVRDTLDIEAVIASVKDANLIIHPYQHRRELQNLFDESGVPSTVPEEGFELYEKLGDKGVFHTYLMENGRQDLCAPMRMIISQGAQLSSWVEQFKRVIEYSESYKKPLVSRLYIQSGNQVLLEETSQTPWIQTMVVQETRGGGGMGTLVISRNEAKTKWLVVPSDGGVSSVLNSEEELIYLIEELVKTTTITVTPYFPTDVVDGQEQSFSFCITWRDDKFVIAGPHWQRLVNKAFDGFYYDGPCEEFCHVALAKEFTCRFALHLLRKGLLARFPLRAGIDFFIAILPSGERMLIAQDPNMRDTATAGLPLVTLSNNGLELLRGNLVLSQSDHSSIPANEDYNTIAGVIDRLKSRGVPLFGAQNGTGVVLESIPKSEGNGPEVRLLVGFVASSKSERAELEEAFVSAFAE
jgi:hypothetical protein